MYDMQSTLHTLTFFIATDIRIESIPYNVSGRNNSQKFV